MSETPVIERRSIDYIPWSERRGKLWHQAPFWFTGNFVLPTMVVGFIGPQIGLSVGFSFLAILLGACFGTFFMAFHANQGPRMGLPQMIQSRAQFGSRGAVVPFLATVFVYVGFSVFNVVLAAEGLGLILPVCSSPCSATTCCIASSAGWSTSSWCRSQSSQLWLSRRSLRRSVSRRVAGISTHSSFSSRSPPATTSATPSMSLITRDTCRPTPQRPS